jgi:mannosyltransferase
MLTQPVPSQPSIAGATSPVPSVQRRISFEVLAVSCILLLCVALRVYHIGAASLWSDEIFSRYYANLFGLHYLLTDGLSSEPTPPTYYLVLRGWMALWGDSEAALRSLSAVASALCVPVVYFLGRELMGKSQAVLGALLFALCPMSVYFAQEARVYSLFMLAASLVLWAAAVFLRDPRSRKAVVSYVLLATLCLYLHATGVLLVAACGGAVWLFLLTQGARERQALWKWTAWNAFVVLLGMPYFIHTLAASHGGGLDWMPPMSMRTLIYSIAKVVSGELTPYPWPGFLLAALVFVALIASLPRHPLPIRAAVTLVGVPCLFIALVSALSIARPILLPRILLWTIVPLCLILASQILVAGRARYAVLLSCVAAFGTGLFFQMTVPGSAKEPWRESLRAVAPQLERADLVVLSPLFDPMVLTYYAPQVKNVRLWDASLHPTIMNAAAERLHIAYIAEPEILQAINSKHSVWILTNGLDLIRLNGLRSHVPPTAFREWFCGKAPCIGAAEWQPHPE